MHAFIYVGLHVCAYVCISICMHICMHYDCIMCVACMNVCIMCIGPMYVSCMYVWHYACMFICIYMHVCLCLSFSFTLRFFFYSIVSSILFSWSQLVTFSVLLIIFSSSLTQSIFFPFCFLSPGVPYCLSTWLFIFLSYSVCLSLTFYLCFLSRRGAYLQLFTLCNLKLHCRESIRWGINTAIAGGWWTHLEGAE